MNIHDQMPPEIEAMADLIRERDPDPELEDRVVGELTRRGILGPRRRTVIELTGRRTAGVAAAVALLITSGFIMGYLAGSGQDRRVTVTPGIPGSPGSSTPSPSTSSQMRSPTVEPPGLV